jgi:hypothetical protein
MKPPLHMTEGVRLTIGEIDRLIEALSLAAARRDSQARRAKQHPRRHEVAAIEMRTLRARLARLRNGRSNTEPA